MSAFLSDGVVSLRPVTRADLPTLANWRNDPELRQRTREWRPLTDVDQEHWLERISGSARRDYMFVVERLPDYNAVGVVGLCHHEAIDRTAEISFYCGESWARGKGYTVRALTLLLNWGFETLDLRRVWAESYATNEPGLRLLAKLGFVKEGMLREHVYRNGQALDSVLLGLLRREWSA